MVALFLIEISAIGLQAALVTFRAAGLADVTTVEQEPVMGLGDDVCRDIFDELFLRLQGILAVGGQSQPFAHAEDMRIDGHGGLVPDNGTNDIRRLASNALQGLQIVDIIRYLTAVYFYQPLRHLYQVLGFAAGITDRLNVREDIVAGGASHGFSRRVGGKERRRDEIDALVGALRREHDGHEQFEGVAVVQLRLGDGHVLCEPSKYMFEAISLQHAVFSFLVCRLRNRRG